MTPKAKTAAYFGLELAQTKGRGNEQDTKTR